MVDKKYYWLASSVVILIAIFIASSIITSSSPSHTLRFGIFESGSMKYYIIDGDVYINNLFMGTTKNGLLDIKTCVPGNVEFIPDINIDLKENDKPKFELTCNIFIHDFSLASKEKIISELAVASSFIPFLIYDNTLVKKNAVEIIQECKQNDKACMTNNIFNTITSNIKYVEDVRDVEHVQSIADTLTVKAGDCEDFTILLSSYLETIGIKTILLLTNNHIYTLACGLDKDAVSSLTPLGRPFFWYDIQGERCFVTDPTIEDSYMGYSANILGEKIAVDPITREYFILDRQS